MKRLILFFTAVLQFTGKVPAQHNIQSVTRSDHPFLISYFPSALYKGAVSLGAEVLFNSRFSSELAAGFRTFKTQFNEFGKGFRVDYLAKYKLISKSNWWLSAVTGIMHEQAAFNDRAVYYYQSDLYKYRSTRPAYQVLLEDKDVRIFGTCTGVGIYARVVKRVYVGSDLLVNFENVEWRHFYKQVIYREPYLYDPFPPVPYAHLLNYWRFVPRMTFKVSYRI